MIYTPANWYWIVGGDKTRVFSSAKSAYVSTDDPDHKAWMASDNRPSAIGSEADLSDVLLPHGMSLTGPVRKAAVSTLLDALSASQRATITPDHMGRLVARSGLGHVIITDPKVGRAAADMGITPDAWFTLAGV